MQNLVLSELAFFRGERGFVFNRMMIIIIIIIHVYLNVRNPVLHKRSQIRFMRNDAIENAHYINNNITE